VRRVIRLLEQCLPALACLSGAVVPVSAIIADGPVSDAATVPDLDAQMQEIVDFIVRQEQRWQPGRRTMGPFIHQPRKPRRS
jgi:hypothetical protein